MAPVIDVHTHMLNHAWLELLEQHGRPRYTLKAVNGGCAPSTSTARRS
jgi:hypothetical protein